MLEIGTLTFTVTGLAAYLYLQSPVLEIGTLTFTVTSLAAYLHLQGPVLEIGTLTFTVTGLAAYLYLQGPVFEIRTLHFTLAGLAAYIQETQKDKYVTARAAFSDTLLGHWTTEGHGVNQVVQLVQYGKTTPLSATVISHHPVSYTHLRAHET